jgi:argininosuccinate lyase
MLEPQIAGQADKFFDVMLKANDAHALMLLDQGIINDDEAKKLLEFSKELQNRGVKNIRLTADKEDLDLNIEALIVEALGDYIGGKLHTGRSRNDLYAAIQRIKCRDMILDLAEQILDLRKTLLKLSEKNLETVMPGYTHMQPAQPITFGYYLAALGHALERDFERLTAAYSRTNLNPLGACALAGTGFPIDRTLVGGYLGFDGDLQNGLDAVASRDYVADIVFAMTMLLSNIGRMNQDFYFWITSEFSIIRLPDEFVIGSSIMPQKRNPIVFEHTIAKVSHLLGALVSVVTAMKGVPYTHSRATSSEVFATLWSAFGETTTAVKCLSAVLEKIEINKENALDNTMKNFSTATEVAEEMVRKTDISFRTAYSIVKNAVWPLYEKNKTSMDLTLDDLTRASMKIIKKPLHGISSEEVERALSPLENIKKRNILGGPAPEIVLKDIEKMRMHMVDDAEHIKGCKGKLESAEMAVRRRIAKIIG